MGNGFSTQTLKVKTKIGAQRIKTHISKKENALVKQRREIAKLIATDKEQSARIRVEGIIREENLCQVYEWLEMMMELLNQRIKQIETSSACPDDLTETVCTLLYCSRRVDIPELEEVSRLLGAKWGRKWIDANVENRSGRVSRQIIDKLSPQPPTRESVIEKLREIAERHDIDYEPGAADGSGMPAIVGHRDEYTVEFSAKPFGMEWTATEDNMNLWVSRVHEGSQAANAGVVPGSMLIAFNGIPIVGIGAPVVHDKAAGLGLPLRISFRKPSGSTGSEHASVREEVVHRCVHLLKDPSRWDLSDDQKKELCAGNGANAAETAAAVFLAEQMIEQMNAAPPAAAQPVGGPAYAPYGSYPPAGPGGVPAYGGPPMHMQQPPVGQMPMGPTGYGMGEPVASPPMGGPPMGGPPMGGPPMGGPPVGGPPMGGPMGGQPIHSQFDGDESDSGGAGGAGGAGGGMDDLEARFARLRDGL